MIDPKSQSHSIHTNISPNSSRPDISLLCSQSLPLVPRNSAVQPIRIEVIEMPAHTPPDSPQQLFSAWSLVHIVSQARCNSSYQIAAVVGRVVLNSTDLSLTSDPEKELSSCRFWWIIGPTHGFPIARFWTSTRPREGCCPSRRDTYGSSGSKRIRQQMIRPMAQIFVLLVTCNLSTAQV